MGDGLGVADGGNGGGETESWGDVGLSDGWAVDDVGSVGGGEGWGGMDGGGDGRGGNVTDCWGHFGVADGCWGYGVADGRNCLGCEAEASGIGESQSCAENDQLKLIFQIKCVVYSVTI